VRHQEVGSALRPLLGPNGIEVSVDPDPEGLEEVSRSLIDALGGHPIWPPIGRCETWRGWELPGDLVRELFDAAADF